MKTHRVLSVSAAVLFLVVAAAGVAHSFSGGDPAALPTPSPIPSPTPSESIYPVPSPEASPSSQLSPDQTPVPSPSSKPADSGSEDSGSLQSGVHGEAPEASGACKGLENAIANHEAHLAGGSESHGQLNSLSHLKENLAKHGCTGSPGTSEGSTDDSHATGSAGSGSAGSGGEGERGDSGDSGSGGSAGD